ncbi:MAG: TetR/AcrR family transcriptional regulator [Planctomycetota bacterium]
MGTQTRKQREIAARHRKILEVAREHLLAGGYLGLSMDRIAAEVQYSKGTIYQHFPNKEEVVVALAIETAGVRLGVFERAATFQGKTRERMMAIGVAAEALLTRFPNHFLCEQIARAALVEKVSSERQLELGACENRCMGICAGIVRDAVAQGDLIRPEDTRIEEIAFGLWAAAYGVFTIMTGKQISPANLGITNPLETLHKNQHRLLDGYGWRPLSSEHDYEATRDRIWREVIEPAFQALEEDA